MSENENGAGQKSQEEAITMNARRMAGARNARNRRALFPTTQGTRAKLFLVVSLSLLFYLTGSVRGSGDEPAQRSGGQVEQAGVEPAGIGGRARALRDALTARVGNLDKVRVPVRNTDLPQPTLADGVNPDPRFATTEAKRYLGKQLFFDPVRSNRIKPEFGGLISTARTGSCGSCHLGEVAGRAGQVINIHLGGEGRGFTDASGGFHVRRRPLLGMEDLIPTGVQQIVGGVVLKDGRFDAVDAVPRLSPSMIGFGFNTRLLLGGKAGQPAGDPGQSREEPESGVHVTGR